MIRDNFTGNADDRQTSRSGIRSERRGREQNRSPRTHNLLTAALFLTLLIVGCSLLIVTADEADTAAEGNYEYTVSSGHTTINKYIGSEKTVNIPSTLGGYAVITINQFAFENKTTLESVTISKNVSYIGKAAFQGCTGLKSVTIPDSVTSTDILVFYQCTSLESVTIGNGITTINSSMFNGCTNLKTVTIGNSVKTISYGVFLNCGNLRSIYIPDSVTSIDDYAFSVTFYDTDSTTTIGSADIAKLKGSLFTGTGDGKLTKVDLSSLTVNGIKYSLDSSTNTATVTGYVAESMPSGGEVTIPPTVTDNRIGTPVTYKVTGIGDNAFQDCTELTSLTIDNSVTSIGTGAFTGCTDLATVTFGTGITGENISWGIGFYDADGKTEIKNADNIKGNTFFKNSAGNLAKPGKITLGYSGGNTEEISKVITVTSETYSSYTSGFISVTIGDGVTSIGASAFKDCTSLESVTIPSTVTSIGSEAFFGCSGLTTINIPKSVTVINDSTFQNCSELATMKIEGQITKVGSGAFNGCSKLEFKNKDGTAAIDIICSLTEIGQLAFNKCEKITTVTIGNSVKTIGDNTFSSCTGLTTVTIGNGVTSIGDWAFEGCTKLKSIIIPDSVKTIGNEAFKGCISLESMTVPNSVTSIGTNAFQNCTGLKSVTIPGSVGTIKANTFDNCAALETVVIGNGITGIGEYAFNKCLTLKTVVMSDAIASDGIKSNAFSVTFKDGNDTIQVGDYSKGLKGGTFLYNSDASALVKVDSVTEGGFTYTFSGTDATVTGYNGSAANVTIPLEVTNKGITYSVTAIGEGAFKNLTGLTAVTIQNSVKKIENSAFNGCTGLTKVTIPNSVTYIGGSVFYNCTGLTEITMPDSVTFIGANAFNSSGIRSVIIPNGVTTIEGYTFAHCANLASVTISDSVTNIDGNAFDDCTGLTTVTFGNNITTIASDAFDVTFKDAGGTELTPSTSTDCNYMKGKTFKGTDGTLTEYIPTVTEGGVVYTLSLADKTAVVFRYKGSPTDVTILSKVTDSVTGTECTVTTVGESAFDGCTSLTSVVIPDSVTTMNNNIFRGCTNLREVTLGKSVTGFGANTFDDCSDIKLTVLCTVKDGMFNGEKCFIEVIIGDDVKSIGINAFNGCENLSSVNFGNGVETIGNSAFFQCYALTTVVIPDSVTSIGEYAFLSCSGLTTVTFGDGITTIGRSAFGSFEFYDSDGTTELTADDDLKNNTFIKTGDKLVKSDALILTDENGIKYRLSDADHTATVIGYTGSGTDVTIPSTVSKDGVTYTVKTIGKDAFKGKTLTSVTIGNNVADIGESAFENCTGLTTLSIANGVTTIGESAFSGCTGLESITIGSEATGILAAFSGFTFYDSDGESLLTTDEALRNSTFIKTEGKLVKTDAMILIVDEIKYRLSPDGTATVIGYTGGAGAVTIPLTVTDGTTTYRVTGIGNNAFKGKTLTSVTIGNNVTDIGESAFENCTGLTSVSFGSSVRTIKTNAFSGCTGLITVTIPESVETIGNNAFTGCTGLTTLSIANGVTTIGESAFGGCTGIMSVEIPNSVTDIKASAFNGCTSLTRAQIGNHTATIGEKAFYGCPLTYLCIPASVTFIGASAFNLVTFHDADGTQITDLDAEHLKDSIFEGTSSSEMRKTGSAPAYTDSNEFQFPFIIFCVIITLLALAIMFSKKRL